MTKQAVTENFKRDNYGMILPPQIFSPTKYLQDLFSEAECMILAAEKSKKIQTSYNNIETKWKNRQIKNRWGSALQHEIYDISDDARHVLVCVRSTEGDKYGIKTTGKDYFIISAHGHSVRVVAASKAKAAKAAKQAQNPGDAILVCLGKKKLTVPAMEKEN